MSVIVNSLWVLSSSLVLVFLVYALMRKSMLRLFVYMGRLLMRDNSIPDDYDDDSDSDSNSDDDDYKPTVPYCNLPGRCRFPHCSCHVRKDPKYPECGFPRCCYPDCDCFDNGSDDE